MSISNIKNLIIISFISLGFLTTLSAQWIQLSMGTGDNLYGLEFTDENIGYAVGWNSGSSAKVLKTEDGGETWNSSILANGGFVFSINFFDDNIGFAAGCLNGGSAGAVFKTFDGGESWLTSSMSQTYGLYDVEFLNADTAFACGWLGKIYRTSNGGSTWSTVNSGTSNVLRWMQWPDATNGFIVGGSNWNNPNILYKTTNEGLNWSFVKSFAGTVIGGVHFFDENIGLIAGGNSGMVIMRTEDGGLSWETVYSKDNGLFQTIKCFPNGTGYAAGNNGEIVKTNDFGLTWSELEDCGNSSTTLLGITKTENSIYTVGYNGVGFKKEIDLEIEGNYELRITNYELKQNYPNPFNPTTEINYELRITNYKFAEIVVHNSAGQTVWSSPVAHYGLPVTGSFQFDGSNLNSGIYYYSLVIDGQKLTTKSMILIK